MSNRPYGLSRDPFDPPATLSAREASRLIRRRVNTSGGDGAALFPIETTDEIHRLAQGVPDAILRLAGQALRFAASEGAPAVAAAHVRVVAVAGAEAGAQGIVGDAVADPESQPGADTRRGKTGRTDAGQVEDHRPRDGSRGGHRPGGAATHPPPAGPPGDHPKSMPAGDPASTAPEFPEVVEAGFVLPSGPSPHLPQDAREWVARFLPGPGPGSASGPGARLRLAGPGEAAASVAPGAPPATAPAPPLPAIVARPLPRRRSKRRRRGAAARGVATAVIVLSVALLAVRYSQRARSLSSGGPAAVPASREVHPPEPPAADPVAATATEEGDVPPPEPESSPASERKDGSDREPAATPAASEAGPPPAAAPAATTPATALPTGRDPASPLFGLEVATFIVEDRARSERERLAASGKRARILSEWEYGTRVYRVVVGGYPHAAAAERAADSLLSSGLVVQARVVRLSAGR